MEKATMDYEKEPLSNEGEEKKPKTQGMSNIIYEMSMKIEQLPLLIICEE